MKSLLTSVLFYGIAILLVLAFPVVGPNIVGGVAVVMCLFLVMAIFVPEKNMIAGVIEGSGKYAGQYPVGVWLGGALSHLGLVVLLALTYKPGELGWQFVSLLTMLVVGGAAGSLMTQYRQRVILAKY